jgi:hypothetical protein
VPFGEERPRSRKNSHAHEDGAKLGKRKNSGTSDLGQKALKDKKAAKAKAHIEEEEEEVVQKPKKKVKEPEIVEPEEKVFKKWVPGQAAKLVNNAGNPMQKSSLNL